jgi:2-polyprenyl-6-methoxyphenol hydroxylase-like FAD-dependent oxidoreductase
LHSAAGGQGTRTGIRDAALLGDLHADVPVGGADPAVLDDYERIRRHVAGEVVRLTDRMPRAATAGGRNTDSAPVAVGFARRCCGACMPSATHVPPTNSTA